jgi:hypothetical protein
MEQRMTASMNNNDYNVAISYVDEDWTYAGVIAELLQLRDIDVLYDQYEMAKHWNKINLYKYFIDMYQEKTRCYVMFISNNYAALVV